MVTLKDYLNPISIDKPEFEYLSGAAKFSHNIAAHTDNTKLNDISKYNIAILGVPEGRNSVDTGPEKSPDAIREKLYNLSRIPGKPKIIDLGNMKQGVSFNDTLAGLTDVLNILFIQNVFPVIIGGSSALIPAIDRCLSLKKLPYTMVSVDSRIDFNSEKKDIDSSNYLYNIIYNHKSSISHFINIGYQTYLNDYQVINRFLKKQFDLFRIGDIRQTINLTEPLFRDSDVTVFDISAVRQSDAPGTSNPSPNGFYGEEICLLARYAGISDTLKVFGLFDVNPDFDIRFQTSGLAAQILWFFLEGFSQKQLETPSLNDYSSGRFKRYHVRVTDLEDDLIFVKSNLTDRWWIEIRSDGNTNKYVACSYEDYIKANHNEVPDRWVKAVARLK
jgi:formiminoglutamase